MLAVDAPIPAPNLQNMQVGLGMYQAGVGRILACRWHQQVRTYD